MTSVVEVLEASAADCKCLKTIAGRKLKMVEGCTPPIVFARVRNALIRMELRGILGCRFAQRVRKLLKQLEIRNAGFWR